MEENLAIELTRYCDKACRHCGTDARYTRKFDETSMTFDTARRILEDIIWTNKHRHMKKIRRVHLTGGEPFLWKEREHRVGDIVREVIGAGLTPQILTSGTTPRDKGFERYMEGFDSISDVPPFNVFHSFNLYMIGVSIIDRSVYTIRLFDDLFSDKRDLGFYSIYDQENVQDTLKTFDQLMQGMGYKKIKRGATRNWEKLIEKGEHIFFVYSNRNRKAECEFNPVDPCAGRAEIFKLKPVIINDECPISSKKKGILPVISYMGDVHPCWFGPYPQTRPLGNIHEDHLSTILRREKAYLGAFRAFISGNYDGNSDICGFCIGPAKEALKYQFSKN